MKADLYVPAGVRVIRGNNLGEGLQLKGDFVHVTNGTADSLASCCLTPGDLVFPHRGNIGEVGITPDDGHRYMLSTSLMKLSPNRSKVDPLYLFYFFKSVTGRAALLMNASQVGTPGIATPLKSLRGIALALPPLEIQRAITAFLQALDDRITLLRETNATLEAIAQALFKSWFVDFDPVRAKMEGRTPEGMDEATAALFPDGFETSELGEVPRGWRIGELGDVAALKGGKQLSKEAFSNSAPNPVFGGAGVMGHTEQRNATDFVITVGRVGAYCGQFFWHIGDAWVNNNASHVVPSGKISSEWLLLWLKSVNMDVIKKGAAQPFVSNGDIAKLSMIHPPIELIGAFGALVAPMFARSQLLVQQSVELASVRDTLLPRLISGQLRLDENVGAINA